MHSHALLSVLAVLGLAACKSNAPSASLRDTFSTTGQFSETKLKLVADQQTGNITGWFDGTKEGLAAGDQVDIHFGIYPAQSLVACEALPAKQTITLRGETVRLQFSLQVDPRSLQEQWSVVEQAVQAHARKGPYAHQASYKGHPVVEGCLKVAGKSGFAAQGSGIPETTRAGFGLQDGDDPGDPAHIQYAKRCMEAIGYVPPINCNEMGQVVPITKDGALQNTNPDVCDKPVYLPTGETFCNTNTRVGRLPLFKDASLTERVSDREAQAVFFCRHYKQQTPEHKYFSDVAIIMQNQRTGKSCFFQALGDALYGHRVPPPNETDEAFAANVSAADKQAGALPATRFWLKPSSVARIHCVACHDNDPFMHSPWIDQVEHTDGSLIVPSMPFADYKIIGAGFGFERWDTAYAIEPHDNADCSNCHRVTSLTTCREWLPDAYPLHADGESARNLYQARFKSDWAKAHPNHHWMPPPWEWPGGRPASGRPLASDVIADVEDHVQEYEASVKDYRRCCQMIRDKAPGTGFINRPTGHTFSDEDLDTFDAAGCYVYPASEVIER